MKNLPATVLRDDAGTFFEIESFGADRVLLTATSCDRVRAVLSLPVAVAADVADALRSHAARVGGAA